jgi:hypothetical protein
LYQKQPGRAGAAEVTGSCKVAGRAIGVQNNPYASAASAVSTEQMLKATCRKNSEGLISHQMRHGLQADSDKMLASCANSVT